MTQYTVKNTTKNMWLQSVSSEDEVVETNQLQEAMIFENPEDAEILSQRFSEQREDNFQIFDVQTCTQY